MSPPEEKGLLWGMREEKLGIGRTRTGYVGCGVVLIVVSSPLVEDPPSHGGGQPQGTKDLELGEPRLDMQNVDVLTDPSLW